MAGQEHRRQGEDEDQPGNDEADPTYDGTGRPPQPPSAEDGQLRRRRTRQHVGGGNAILEFTGVDPPALFDAQTPEQGDVGGRTAEADTADSGPLPGDGGQRHPGCSRRAIIGGLAHGDSGSRTSSANTRNWTLVFLSSARPLAVAT